MESIISSNAVRGNENAAVLDGYLHEECTICFEPFTNKAFVDDCLHHFCYECILSWAKIKPVCPLCIQPITGIINNIRSEYEYDVQNVLPPQTDYYDLGDSDNDVNEFTPDYSDTESSYGGLESMSFSDYDSSFAQPEEFSEPEILEPFAEPVGENFENPPGSGSFYLTDDEDHSELITNHSFSDNNETSYDEDEDKDDNDNSENDNEEYYEENNEDEDDYDNNNNEDEYEADDDDYNEDESYYDFSYQPESDNVDDEWDYESSNFNNDYQSVHYNPGLCEDNINEWTPYCQQEDEDYDDNEHQNDVKFHYTDNSDSEQDYLSNDDAADYIYSSGYY